MRQVFRHGRGFTLIELLVVISIISLLSSVILAALSQGRVQARDSKRIQEVRQIDLAVHLYQSNHDNAVPPLTVVTGGNGKGCDYTNTSISSSCVARSSGNAAWTAFTGEIAPYMPTVPTGAGGIDYVYVAPAAMSIPTISSYQVSTGLESNPTSGVSGYTTDPVLRYIGSGSGGTYSINVNSYVFTTPITPMSYPPCTVTINGTAASCSGGVVSGLTNGTYIINFPGSTAYHAYSGIYTFYNLGGCTSGLTSCTVTINNSDQNATITFQ